MDAEKTSPHGGLPGAALTGSAMDALLGDPAEETNPVGRTAVLAADERREMLAEGEKLLDAVVLNAEFVPAGLGGRFTSVPRLAEVLRAVWRRDPSLGAGYGFSSFLAAVNVWCAGDAAQRRHTADVLLGGDRVAVAFHELAHGNDFAQAEFQARAQGGGWQLTGRKETIANLCRARALVLFARTGAAVGSRSHSEFLLDKAELPAAGWCDLPRYHTSGMRGLQLGGMEFTDCPIPGTALIGAPGQAVEIALRAFQITRSMFPAVCVGSLDTALRITLDCALERRLYGGTVADIPFVRSTVARAFADLLAIDALASVGVRALHLAPESTAVYASASKFLGPRMMLDAFEDLRAVLGAQGYLRQGPHALFQKLFRDAAPITFTHASRGACLSTILPQLPRLARRSWLSGPAGPADLFDLDAPVPPLDFQRLAVGMPTTDGVIGALAEMAENVRAPGREDPLSRLVARFGAELGELRSRCAELSPSDLTMDAPAAAYELAERYTVVLAAACALAVWRAGGERHPGRPDAGLLGVLDRLCGRLPGAGVLTATERASVEAQLFDLAVARFTDRALFDLTARPIPG